MTTYAAVEELLTAQQLSSLGPDPRATDHAVWTRTISEHAADPEPMALNEDSTIYANVV